MFCMQTSFRSGGNSNSCMKQGTTSSSSGSVFHSQAAAHSTLLSGRSGTVLGSLELGTRHRWANDVLDPTDDSKASSHNPGVAYCDGCTAQS